MVFDWLKRAWIDRPAEETEPAPSADSPTPAKATPAKAELPLELVAKRAYEIWCGRGRPTDSQVPDWLAAEAELRAEMAGKPLPPAGPAVTAKE